MSPPNLPMIAVLALIVWRFVFTGLRRRLLVREIAPQQQQRFNFLEHGLQILDRCAAVNRFENGSDGGDPIDQNDRAKTYLRRIAALTGAKQMGDTYVLDVEKMQFHVRPRYVKRLRDTTVPECTFEETCFYTLHKGMPKAEEIATVLLQLKNNPALFDKWAAQSGLFRADGQAFRPAQ